MPNVPRTVKSALRLNPTNMPMRKCRLQSYGSGGGKRTRTTPLAFSAGGRDSTVPAGKSDDGGGSVAGAAGGAEMVCADAFQARPRAQGITHRAAKRLRRLASITDQGR